MESKLEKISKIKALIEKTEKSIEQKTSSLNEIDKDLSLKRKEINDAEEKVLKFRASKIFTKKELERFKIKKLNEEKEKFEYEKTNITKQTEEIFKKADLVRKAADSKDVKEQSIADKIACDMELNALKREVYILGCVLKDKTSEFENILAQEICKKMYLRSVSSLNGDSTEKKENIFKIKTELKNLKNSLDNVWNEVNDANLRLKKSISKLNEYKQV